MGGLGDDEIAESDKQHDEEGEMRKGPHKRLAILANRAGCAGRMRLLARRYTTGGVSMA